MPAFAEPVEGVADVVDGARLDHEVGDGVHAERVAECQAVVPGVAVQELDMDAVHVQHVTPAEVEEPGVEVERFLERGDEQHEVPEAEAFGDEPADPDRGRERAVVEHRRVGQLDQVAGRVAERDQLDDPAIRGSLRRLAGDVDTVLFQPFDDPGHLALVRGLEADVAQPRLIRTMDRDPVGPVVHAESNRILGAVGGRYLHESEDLCPIVPPLVE